MNGNLLGKDLDFARVCFVCFDSTDTCCCIHLSSQRSLGKRKANYPKTLPHPVWLSGVAQIKCLTGFSQEPVYICQPKFTVSLSPALTFPLQQNLSWKRRLGLFPVNINHVAQKEKYISWAFLTEVASGSRNQRNRFKVTWLQRKDHLLKLIDKSGFRSV